MTELNRQKKKSDDELAKMAQKYMPKVKQTIEFQKEIIAELKNIKADSELLPKMFQQLAAERATSKENEENAIAASKAALDQKAAFEKTI
jgi:DNA repair ATPase RecN